MFGTPITYAPVIASGDHGYVVVIALNDLLVREVTEVNFVVEGKIVKAVESDLDAIFSLNSTNLAFAMAEQLLYIYVPTSIPYSSDVRFFVLGYRSAIPIRSLEQEIDVPEYLLELFTKYVIREAALLKGKMVPPSIQHDIQRLENEVKNGIH